MNLLCLSSSVEEVDFLRYEEKTEVGKFLYLFYRCSNWIKVPPPSPNSSRFGATSSAEEDRSAEEDKNCAPV
jgi:hypothetical protein